MNEVIVTEAPRGTVAKMKTKCSTKRKIHRLIAVSVALIRLMRKGGHNKRVDKADYMRGLSRNALVTRLVRMIRIPSQSLFEMRANSNMN